MNRPTRASPAGRAFLDLRKLAKAGGRPTDELLQLYTLEGFLARLADSPDRDRFVLKGGVLLAAFNARRPTRDIDFAGIDMSDDADTVRQLVVDVAGTYADDGLEFDTGSAAAEVIRDDDEYPGVRVSMLARLGLARSSFHVDVNIGDPVSPAPQTVDVPRLLGGDDIVLRGYPLHMVYAEKLVTAMQRGTANTRWRDFGDVWHLSRTHPVGRAELYGAMVAVAEHRGAELVSLARTLPGFGQVAQARYAAWRRRRQMDQLPAEFETVLRDIYAFADPVLLGAATGQVWDPGTRRWSE